MLLIREFVGTLAALEIEVTVKTIYSNKALKKTQLYEIIKKDKEGKSATDQTLFNGKRGKVRDPTFLAEVTSDRSVTA
jgi:hypothetical protein